MPSKWQNPEERPPDESPELCACMRSSEPVVGGVMWRISVSVPTPHGHTLTYSPCPPRLGQRILPRPIRFSKQRCVSASSPFHSWHPSRFCCQSSHHLFFVFFLTTPHPFHSHKYTCPPSDLAPKKMAVRPLISPLHGPQRGVDVRHITPRTTDSELRVQEASPRGTALVLKAAAALSRPFFEPR